MIHPVLAAGQIEGGVAQAIGMALYENVVWREGRMANGQMTNYIMPTAADIPPIRVFFEEQPYPFGPRGAKGIGELPMDGPAAAIVNAIQEATGICVREIPATPEVMMEAMTEKAKRIKLGPPLERETKMGPLVSKEQYERVNSYLELGKKEAKTAIGGGRPKAFRKGYYVEPTIFYDVDNSARISRENSSPRIFNPKLESI